MRGYELCLIVNSDVSEEGIDALLASLTDVVTRHKGNVLKIEKWGKKNFKYSIKKQSKGIYCFLYFMGNNDILREIDRSVRFNESVLRYTTMTLDPHFTLTPPAAPVSASEEEESTSPVVAAAEAESGPAQD